jgi:glycosyltransferase involved in cell wall biosynthesis
MGRETLRRLAATQKYELFELAAYGSNHDPRSQGAQWHFIGNLPDPGNQEQESVYNSDNLNQFGKFRFESALLATKPDHVLSWQDPFQVPFLMISPFRDFYNLNFMPTVDSRPQMIDWIAQFAQCDNILTYTQFAYDLLAQYENINLIGKAPPAADYDIYKPLPKEKVREFYGVDRDALIIGMVCRNQKRKLISDLLECFSKYLATAPLTLSHRSFLYLHTSSPDQGFMLNELLKEFNLSSKVLFTYKCNSCQTHYPAFWQGEHAVCKKCGQYTLILPSTQFFLHDVELAQIYNLMDVYAQFAALGGFEIPTLEAAACGVPTFAIDFSCLEDFKNTIGSFPIKVKNYYREVETHRLYAMPDYDDFIGKLIKFLELPEVIKNKKRFEVQKLARQNYSWDRSAQAWMEIFDRTPLRDPRSTWYSQSRYRDPDINIPDGIDNVTFMKWAYANILGLPQEIGNYEYQKMLRDLNNGFIFQGRYIPIDRNSVVQSLVQRRQFFNFWELERMKMIQSETQNV